MLQLVIIRLNHLIPTIDSIDPLEFVFSQLLQLYLNSNVPDSLHRKLTSSMAESISSILLRDPDQSQQMQSTLVKWLNDSSPRLREGSLTIFTSIIPRLPNIFKPFITNFIPMIEASFSDITNTKLCLIGFNMLISVLDLLDAKDKSLIAFQPLADRICQVL